MGEGERTNPSENVMKALDPSLEENAHTKSFGRRLCTACSPAVHPFQTHIQQLPPFLCYAQNSVKRKKVTILGG